MGPVNHFDSLFPCSKTVNEIRFIHMWAQEDVFESKTWTWVTSGNFQ